MLLPLGVLAGGLTTVAGLGGGVLLILALSLATSPAEALATTSPALLVGNLHRLIAGRRELDLAVARPLALGALPGSALGGLVTVAVPTVVLEALLVLTTGLALARTFGRLNFKPGARALGPAGFGIGLATATTGGGALLLAPLLMTTGLTGARYVATAAGVAVAIHVGRLIGYGAGGLVTQHTLAGAAALAAAIVVGNALGERVRRRIDAATGTRLELGVLLVCVALALAGLV
ncbi:MAG: TSUP family transporter [Myxococcales bacterium]|nr:TSUP family transporter [Myxococcales bacterium]